MQRLVEHYTFADCQRLFSSSQAAHPNPFVPPTVEKNRKTVLVALRRHLTKLTKSRYKRYSALSLPNKHSVKCRDQVIYGTLNSSSCRESGMSADDSLLQIDWLDPSLLLLETEVVQQPTDVTQSLLQGQRSQSTTCSNDLPDQIRRRRENNRHSQRRHQQKKKVSSTFS